jgi:hypothetical protein
MSEYHEVGRSTGKFKRFLRNLCPFFFHPLQTQHCKHSISHIETLSVSHTSDGRQNVRHGDGYSFDLTPQILWLSLLLEGGF